MDLLSASVSGATVSLNMEECGLKKSRRTVQTNRVLGAVDMLPFPFPFLLLRIFVGLIESLDLRGSVGIWFFGVLLLLTWC